MTFGMQRSREGGGNDGSPAITGAPTGLLPNARSVGAPHTRALDRHKPRLARPLGIAVGTIGPGLLAE
jgi:hypothetical protein